MHNVEFVWTVPNDDNRVGDGLDLRSEYFDGVHRRKYQREDLVLEGVTVLEILISLSRRLAWMIGGEASYCAWRLLENLKLHKSSDPLTDAKANKVDEAINDLIWRTYERNGQGGFFPLKSHLEDQTKVEIWYQMNAYVIEMQGL
jgi:hypothetical protein